MQKQWTFSPCVVPAAGDHANYILPVGEGGPFPSRGRRRTDTGRVAQKRQDEEKLILDALLAWANETMGKVAPKFALGKALYYLQEQWPHLIRYLEDGWLELSNNQAERSIKPFVIGRKNWLFANTPGGAQSSSVIYSLIETAKENGLDPYRYLLWVLRSAPALSQTDESWAAQLLSENAPPDCHTPKT